MILCLTSTNAGRMNTQVRSAKLNIQPHSIKFGKYQWIYLHRFDEEAERYEDRSNGPPSITFGRKIGFWTPMK